MNKNTKTNNKTSKTSLKNNIFNVRLKVMGGKFKVMKAEKRVEINQYSPKYIPTNSRDLSRAINRLGLIIK
jgi:hypothetical protein